MIVRPPVYDLVRLGRTLEKRREGKALFEAVERLRGAAIILRSLGEVRSLLRALSAIAIAMREGDSAEVAEDFESALVGGALLGQALITYFRVRHGTGDPYAKFTVSLGAELDAVQKALLVVRDEVVAHYAHKKPHKQGPWDRQFVLLVADPDAPQVRIPWLRGNWRRQTAEDLQQVLNAVEPLAIAHRDTSHAAVWDELGKFTSRGPDFLDLMRKCEFDTKDFNGPVELIFGPLDAGAHLFDPVGEITTVADALPLPRPEKA